MEVILRTAVSSMVMRGENKVPSGSVSPSRSSPPTTVSLCRVWDFSSPTRDLTHALCGRSAKS